jgi:hypothetical protein
MKLAINKLREYYRAEMNLRAVEPRRVDDLEVALHGRDPGLLGLDDERAARSGLSGDGGGTGEGAPGTEERGLEHGRRRRGGGGGRERHGWVHVHVLGGR